MKKASELKVGDELDSFTKYVSPERIEWYDSGMLSAASGFLAQVGVNIHTDEAYAKEHGLPSANADGMISTNWCQTMLMNQFGMDFVHSGELFNKYIKPVPINSLVVVKGKVTAIAPHAKGKHVSLDIWCENDEGTKMTDGRASVVVTA
jgi:hypothetical protein